MIRVGQRVRHWYAGAGYVASKRGVTATVKWVDGSTGIAWLRDLKPDES